jgi:antitoxin CptB
MKESDNVIGGFAERYLAQLDDSQLAKFEALLDCPDQDLLAWVVGVEAAPPPFDNDVLAMMREFGKSRRK